ncbi:hypothetical protein STPH1_0344 [Streptomyces sp. OM5714]|nr:hypothetical protein STPH1_0344 [Streptomyces sp. OM5714]
MGSASGPSPRRRVVASAVAVAPRHPRPPHRKPSYSKWSNSPSFAPARKAATSAGV